MKATAIDYYYKKPVLYDYLLSILLMGVLFYLHGRGYIGLPNPEQSFNFSSDVGAIGLTISGFLLTLITILLTLKSGQLLSGEKLRDDSSAFKIFLGSQLYNRSIDILKYGVLSLIFISMLIYVLKLSLSSNSVQYLFYANLTGLLIILSTFMRCFHVLGLIMKMQST